MKLYLRIYLVVACSIVLPTVAHAIPLNIGPVHLGMSNAEVVKVVKLSDCTLDNGKMVCSARLPNQSFEDSLRIIFDPNTRRVIRVSLKRKGWASDDLRLPLLYGDLDIKPCKPEQLGEEPNWFSKELCIVEPDQVRTIRWDGGRASRLGSHARSITIEVFKHKGMHKEFRDKRAAERAKLIQNKANRSFEQGK